MSAIISECGKYRYTLTREIEQITRQVKPCLFIMLNPSTADHTKDDRTIRKCLKFAKREGCTSLTVVNLWAFRATNPSELLGEFDAFGPRNHHHIANQISNHKNGLIVCAWGSHKAVRASNIASKVVRIISDRTTPYCLKINKDGNPAHPLYIRDDEPLKKLSTNNWARGSL